MTTNKVTLGHWDIRGFVEPARTLLEYFQIPYDQELYKDEETWKAKKDNFGSKFANLPYFVDCEKVITETAAIFSYICVKAGKREMAVGKPEDLTDFLQIQGVVLDIRRGLGMAVYGAKEREDVKKIIDGTVMEKGGPKFNDLNEILGEKDWLLGYLTYNDFVLAELLERYSDMDAEVGSSVMKNYPNLQAFIKRFVELPGVKEYRASDKFAPRPHNAWMAVWQ